MPKFIERTEEWKDVPGYDGYYQVSNMGRVRTFRNGRWGRLKTPNIKKEVLDNRGYPKIQFSRGYKYKTFKTHKLVAELFIPNPDNKPQVNHKDGNKLNNATTNLEWCTNAENRQHAISNGLVSERFGGRKLTKRDVKKIRAIKKDKPRITMREIAEMFKVSDSQIRKIVNHRAWKRV